MNTSIWAIHTILNLMTQKGTQIPWSLEPGAGALCYDIRLPHFTFYIRLSSSDQKSFQRTVTSILPACIAFYIIINLY